MKKPLTILGLIPIFAMAAELTFTSPQGFSITPPDGWAVASKEIAGQLSRAVQEHFQKLGNIDLDKLAVVIFNPNDAEGSQNLNVVVSPHRIPIDESDAEEKLVKMLKDQYAQIGVQIGSVAVNRKTFGTHAALVSDVESNFGGPPMRQWQVMLPAGSRTLIVTCSAPQASFGQAIPAFTKAIESMTYTTVTDPLSEMPVWLREALIGALIGGAITLYRVLASRRRT